MKISEKTFSQMCNEVLQETHNTENPASAFQSLLGKLRDYLKIDVKSYLGSVYGLPDEVRYKTTILRLVETHCTLPFDPTPIMNSMGRKMRLKGYTNKI